MYCVYDSILLVLDSAGRSSVFVAFSKFFLDPTKAFFIHRCNKISFYGNKRHLYYNGFKRSYYRRQSYIRLLNQNLPEGCKEINSTYAPLTDSLDDPESDSVAGITSDDLNLQQNIARGVLLAVSAFYGTNFSCVKLLGETLDPSLAAFLPSLLLDWSLPHMYFSTWEICLYFWAA